MTDLAASSNITLLNLLNAEAARRIYSQIAQGDIRLVRLHPPPPGDGFALSCTIIATSQSAAPVYAALSYVWGSQEDPACILLNGEVYRVTQNLHLVLSRLRRPDGDRLLWIDALAINQLDIVE
jgi:hypothetical protein